MKNQVFEAPFASEVETNENGLSQTSSVLDLLVEEESSKSASFAGVLVGKLVGFDEAGMPFVSFMSDVPRERVLARSTIALKAEQVGSDVAVVFERGNLREPIIIGCLWQCGSSSPQGPIVAELDGERIVLTAKKEIILQCGKASILLRGDGKIIIKGAELLSRASGLNKIKGAAVQIN